MIFSIFKKNIFFVFVVHFCNIFIYYLKKSVTQLLPVINSQWCWLDSDEPNILIVFALAKKVAIVSIQYNNYYCLLLSIFSIKLTVNRNLRYYNSRIGLFMVTVRMFLRWLTLTNSCRVTFATSVSVGNLF